MRPTLASLALSLALLLCPSLSYNISLNIPMRDGVLLFTLLFLPDDLPSGATVGTILIRTPYSTASQAPTGQAYASLGWACALSDERGKYQSGGAYTMWASASNDTADTIAFLAEQPWSSRAFAWTGASANAIMGYVEPLEANPLAPMRAQYNLVGTTRLKGLEYQGGAFREELIVGWLNETSGSSQLPAVLAHELYSSYWAPTTAREAQWGAYTWPTLHLCGWYDIFSTLQVTDALGLDAGGGQGARGAQTVVIEAGGHCAGGAVAWPNASWGRELAQQASLDLFEGALGLGSGAAREGARQARAVLSAIRASVGASGSSASASSNSSTLFVWYLMGSGGSGDLGNLWTAGSREVFLNSTYAPLYLGSAGQLQEAPPQPSSVQWLADPADPIPTLGGNVLMLPECGPQDQRPVQAPHAAHMASFSTAPLAGPLIIHGEVLADIVLSSTAPDTDVMVKLVDVYPTGETMLLVDGALRMRGRGGLYATEFEAPLQPQRAYTASVSLGWFSYVVSPGHGLRVDVSSSNFPRFSVNPNTGQPMNQNSTAPAVATNTLHLGTSALRLPLFDFASLQRL